MVNELALPKLPKTTCPALPEDAAQLLPGGRAFVKAQQSPPVVQPMAMTGARYIMQPTATVMCFSTGGTVKQSKQDGHNQVVPAASQFML